MVIDTTNTITTAARARVPSCGRSTLRPYRRGVVTTTIMINILPHIAPTGPSALRTPRRRHAPAYRVAGVARYATTEDGERNALSLVPHSETPALGNQCFRACPMPNRAHNRPRPALSHVPEFPPASARYMIWRGLSLERLPRGVQSVRFRPPLRIWGIGARCGRCFFLGHVSSLCPVLCPLSDSA